MKLLEPGWNVQLSDGGGLHMFFHDYLGMKPFGSMHVYKQHAEQVLLSRIRAFVAIFVIL